MSHVTHMDESRFTYEWVTHMTRAPMSHVAHMNRWHLIYDWATHLDELCHTCGWVTSCLQMRNTFVKTRGTHLLQQKIKNLSAFVRMSASRIWLSHVTHMNESGHVYEWIMSRVQMRNTFMKIKGHAELLSIHSKTFWNLFLTLHSFIMFAFHCIHFIAFISFFSFHCIHSFHSQILQFI